jgi:hypothetical protein
MAKSSTAAEKRHMSIVASIGCVICLEHYNVKTPCEVHHVSEGSSEQDDFMTAGLCPEHHRGPTGLHGMGVKAFCRLWRLSSEYALVGLVNKYRAIAKV